MMNPGPIQNSDYAALYTGFTSQIDRTMANIHFRSAGCALNSIPTLNLGA
jgi:hypothetical protein